MTPQELLELRSRAKDPGDALKARLAESMFVLRSVQINDSGLAAWMAKPSDRPLSLKQNPVLGWFAWTESRWAPVSQQFATEIVRSNCDLINEALDALVRVEDAACSMLTRGGSPHTDPCQRAQDLRAAMRAYKNRPKINNLTAVLAHTTGVLVENVEAFDRHPHLLNCANGVLDLTDGTLHKADPEWLMTKQTGAEYVPGASHPDINKALEALSDMAPGTYEWFQRVLGSGCSGEQPSDDVNVINYGGGSNGKTTLMGAVMTALGDYAGTVPDSVWGGSADEVRKGLLSFRGKRLMYCEETPDEGRLPTQTIKKLSGSKEVDARALYKGEVTFRPSHTLLMSTNHKPYVKETDKGTWRRLAMVPFSKTFAGEDTTIRSRVEEGKDGRAEAILAWLVEGCVRWYNEERRLKPLPTEVENLTQEWRDANDLVGTFIADAVAFEAGDFTPKSEVHAAFEHWCRTHGLESPYRGQRGFNTAFSAHEYVTGNRVTDARGTGGTKGWTGIRLKAMATASLLAVS